MSRARLLAFLRRLAARGRRCVRRSSLLAALRITPSELEDALAALEREGVVAVGESEVCYTGAIEALEDTSYEEIAGRLKSLARVLARVVEWVRETRGIIPHLDIIVARRDGVWFAARIVSGRLPPERLIAEARHVASTARRLAGGEFIDECCPQAKPRIVVPVVVIRRGAPRLVEGVVVRPVDMVVELIRDPSPLLVDPAVRVYAASSARSSSA